jgi:2',3'-cyclic-nucleotide 2'-phosphodiesterase (5'-nucleotidase family)
MRFIRHAVALLVVLPLLMITLPAQAEDKSVTLTILQTSDLHSNLLPYD